MCTTRALRILAPDFSPLQPLCLSEGAPIHSLLLFIAHVSCGLSRTLGTKPRITFSFSNDKGKGAHEPKAHTAGAYTGFRSMKHA